jgi:hypothetical protein
MMMLRRLALVLGICLAAFSGAPAQARCKVELLWLGQSAFRITTPGGNVILLDPTDLAGNALVITGNDLAA